MIKSCTVRLYPTSEQEKMLWKHVHAARFIYNWALELQMNRFKNDEKHLNKFNLIKELTKYKKEEPWLKEVSSKTLTQATMDLSDAYKKFFKVQKQGKKFSDKTIQRAARLNRNLTVYDMIGHPKFKKRNRAKASFYVIYKNLYFKDNCVNIEKVGKVRYKTEHELPQGRNAVKFSNPRIKYENNKWLITFGIECENQAPVLNDFAMGIDLGITDLAIVSCNNHQFKIKNINKTQRVQKLEKRLKRIKRQLSRKYASNGNFDKSKGIEKAKKQIAKLMKRLANIRLNHTHHATRKLVNMLPHTIVMEDLNVAGMMKNKYLAKAIQEQSFHEFLRQIKYKSEWSGIAFKQADRFYPSSKTCSSCGAVKHDLKLNDRKYLCDECGTEIDRDFNAAVNLEKLAG